ncbi:PREDICTED: reverse mRNAase [Prunus dulcis]|uniref:PREDICTED: reverse mRNAase n=1 Tax=Prunus dulcis TaxID=3755 RepID=A0A5E4F8I9_PRUDU|nr:PREDICTED: reverse mRNAase [Prunus dulcis]
MKILVWNSRGSAWRGFILQILFYISTLCLDVLCILDSRSSRDQADRLVQRLGFNCSFCIPSVGQCGGIILMWNPAIFNISILNYHERYINCELQDITTNKSWTTTFIYTYPQKAKQSNLWREIVCLKPTNNHLWLMLGDFNSICSMNEKVGGSLETSQAMRNFNKFIDDCEVVSLAATGVPFTWCNGHHDNTIIYERLDRALANPDWMRLLPHFELQNLPIVRSDHGPIFLKCNQIFRRIPKNFKFEAMWLAHKDFDQVVSHVWNCSYVGNAAHQIQTCCNTFKHQLKNWNRSVFGDLFHKLRITQENLVLIQEQLAQNPYDPFLLD